MLVFDSFKEINQKVNLTKYSRLCGYTDSCAFSCEDTLTFEVRVPRALCLNHISLLIYSDDDGSETEYDVRFLDFEPDADLFSVNISLEDICLPRKSGLFYHSFALDTPYGRLYTCTDGGLVSDYNSIDRMQLTVYEKDFKTPSRFFGGMMYQIFPDRFSYGDKKLQPGKGKILNDDWGNGIPQFAEVPGGEVENNMFFGGNLWGVADRLDYIKSLGVDVIYLCPIFEAASNHHYDTGDYLKIDSLLGGEDAFVHLLSEMKSRGMKLILDGVFNHTGDDSRYFNRRGNYPPEGACDSVDSPYYNWYSFDSYPDSYKCWWGVKILPAVKSDEPSYLSFICGEDGVVRHYLKMGIDGWRLDVADELSDRFLTELRSAAKSEAEDSLIIGEVWEDASNKTAYNRRRQYFRGGQLDSVMNYPLKDALISFILDGNSAGLANTSELIWKHYPPQVNHVLMNFLGTHDTERILTVLSQAGCSEMTNRQLSQFRLPDDLRKTASERLKSAFALLAAFPGIPCIYYGDEIGMEGGRDPFNRMPMPVGKIDGNITPFISRIGAIRRSEPLFADGGFRVCCSGEKGYFAFEREGIGEKIFIAANFTGKDRLLEFEECPIALISAQKCKKITELKNGTVEYYKLTC